MAMIDVNGIRVYHEVHGPEDAPWVLNIGGSGGDLRRTFPDRSPLNTSFRVLHYDQRGLGRTSRPEVEYTMSDYADDAAALIDSVVRTGGDERCHVVGTSFGGMVALELAARRPDLVDRLVVLVSSPGGDHPSYPLHELELLPPDERLRRRLPLLDTRWDPDADEPIPDLGAVYDHIVAQARDVVPVDVAMGAARQLAARRGHDVVDRLRTIDRPTLVGCGRFDGIAPVENSEFMVERLPDARLEVFEGGHLVMFQDRRLWATVISFLADGSAAVSDITRVAPSP
jgi:pimeloyl-ACP methyl ester carboxylesterase